ncbi:MAG: carbohydrate porin [Terrimicrobiaceae bacterium]|nr:carbohydrate porin [Terrimicrobiaceae bacterium]
MKNLRSASRRQGLRLGSSVLTLLIGTVPLVQAGTATSTGVTVKEESSLEQWWNGKYATGNWFGVRDTLEDYGIKLGGLWSGNFYGFVDGGINKNHRGFFDEQIKFQAKVNFGQLLRIEPLEALSAFGEVRYRDGLNPNLGAGASPNFQPSNIQSGKQWRLTNFGLAYSPALFGVKDFLTLTGGWLQPQSYFIDQPLSKLFVNNSIASSKGIGANIPFSSSFSSWGGILKIKPIDLWYAQGGFFMAYPQATSTANHGLAFQGYEPDQSQNGLYAIAETGLTPKLGESKLPGKYTVGGYYYGEWNNSYNGARYPGRYGFYWQADQMVFREPSPEPEAPVLGKGASDGKSVASAADGKSFKEVKETVEPAKLSDQGLYVFNLFTYSPKYDNSLPFYFHTGLVYKGLIPGRDKDQTLIAFSFGQYSFYNIQTLQEKGTVNQPNYTAVLETGYRVQITDFAYFQPFLQYIIKPNGTDNIENATILGFTSGVIF